MRPGAQGEREIDTNVKYYKLYLQLKRLSLPPGSDVADFNSEFSALLSAINKVKPKLTIIAGGE